MTKRRRDRVELEVHVSKPDLEVIWSKNDRKLETNDQYEVVSEGKFI